MLSASPVITASTALPVADFCPALIHARVRCTICSPPASKPAPLLPWSLLGTLNRCAFYAVCTGATLPFFCASQAFFYGPPMSVSASRPLALPFSWPPGLCSPLLGGHGNWLLYTARLCTLLPLPRGCSLLLHKLTLPPGDWLYPMRLLPFRTVPRAFHSTADPCRRLCGHCLGGGDPSPHPWLALSLAIPALLLVNRSLRCMVCSSCAGDFA